MKRWRRRVSADIDQVIEAVSWYKTPAPPLAQPAALPGQPGAGAAVTSEAATPRAASPGTGHPHDGIYGRCVMTVHFYDTGITVTYDHVRKRSIIDVPPVGEWGGCPGCGRPDGTWCAPGCEYGKASE